jgi:aminomethyltransferase
VVEKQKADKPTRRLICLELEGRVIPRHGYDLFDGDRKIGQVTSGAMSPSLQKPIALGYVPRELSKTGSVVEVQVRDKRFPATVVKPPFYKNASHR